LLPAWERHLDAESVAAITSFADRRWVDVIDAPRTDELNLGNPLLGFHRGCVASKGPGFNNSASLEVGYIWSELLIDKALVTIDTSSQSVR
jgi:hypothetical protein